MLRCFYVGKWASSASWDIRSLPLWLWTSYLPVLFLVYKKNIEDLLYFEDKKTIRSQAGPEYVSAVCRDWVWLHQNHLSTIYTQYLAGTYGFFLSCICFCSTWKHKAKFFQKLFWFTLLEGRKKALCWVTVLKIFFFFFVITM